MNIKLFTWPEYEVEIKAYKNGKENEDDLIYFLNDLSIMARYATKFKKLQGYESSADEYQKFADTLYEICKKAGAYK